MWRWPCFIAWMQSTRSSTISANAIQSFLHSPKSNKTYVSALIWCQWQSSRFQFYPSSRMPFDSYSRRKKKRRRKKKQHQQRNTLGSDHMTGSINETFDAWCAHTYTKKTRSISSRFPFSFTFSFFFHTTQWLKLLSQHTILPTWMPIWALLHLPLLPIATIMDTVSDDMKNPVP